MNQMLHFLKEKRWKKWDKSQWLILVMTGILLMVIAIPVDGGKEKDAPEDLNATEQMAQSTPEGDAYKEQVKKELEETLSQIEGAGAVKVMITWKDNGQIELAKDARKEQTDTKEADSDGGTRTVTESNEENVTVYTENDSAQLPYIKQTMTPQIEGVLVVAEGGKNTEVKQNISDAVMALFQIETHKIKVVKMNSQEESN